MAETARTETSIDSSLVERLDMVRNLIGVQEGDQELLGLNLALRLEDVVDHAVRAFLDGIIFDDDLDD